MNPPSKTSSSPTDTHLKSPHGDESPKQAGPSSKTASGPFIWADKEGLTRQYGHEHVRETVKGLDRCSNCKTRLFVTTVSLCRCDQDDLYALGEKHKVGCPKLNRPHGMDLCPEPRWCPWHSGDQPECAWCHGTAASVGGIRMPGRVDQVCTVCRDEQGLDWDA